MSTHHDPLVELARRLTTPVDVPALVARGVLRRRGPWYARWYQVLDAARLPDWARCQITAMRPGPGGPLVRFARRNRVAARLYEELTGEVPVAAIAATAPARAAADPSPSMSTPRHATPPRDGRHEGVTL